MGTSELRQALHTVTTRHDDGPVPHETRQILARKTRQRRTRTAASGKESAPETLAFYNEYSL